MYNKLLMQINMLVGTVFRSIRQRFYVVSNRVTRFPYNATRAVAQKISAYTFKKEASLKDYVRFGSFYVSKRYLLIGSLLLLAGIYFAFILLQKFGILFYTGYPDQTAGKTGKIKIYDADSKNMLYKGGIDNGLLAKYGEKYYNAKNRPVEYKGDFLNDLYDGYGVLYAEDGTKLYKGSFTAGKYNGEGKEYSINGNLKYSGEFKDGLYEGLGTLYDFKGKKLYSGNFSMGNYDGTGTEFNTAGNIIREGNYLVGKLNGSGKTFFDSGVLRYDGAFKNGLYDGEGALYFENNTLSYKGGFKDNLFDGVGVLYNKNGVKIYEGAFVKGLYEGEGVAYKDDGSILFSGSFKDGKIVEGKEFTPQGKVAKELSTDETGPKAKIFSDKGPDILKYEGGFSNNTYNGQGKVYYEDAANTVKYEGNFKDGTYDGAGTLYDISKAIVYKGYFNAGAADPDQFIGKSDNDLIQVLGKPEDTMELNDNVIFMYPSLNMKFTLNKNNPLNVLKVVSTSLSSAVNIYGVNLNMSESQLRSSIGAPYKTIFASELTPYESPMPVGPPPDAKGGNGDTTAPNTPSFKTEEFPLDDSSDVPDNPEKEDSTDTEDTVKEDKFNLLDLFKKIDLGLEDPAVAASGPGESDSDKNPNEDTHGGSGDTSGSGNYKKMYYSRNGLTFKIIYDVNTGKIQTINISDVNFEK